MSSIEPAVNPNYCATVIRIANLIKLPNSDKLQGIPMFGMQAITDMKAKVGDLGVLFPAEVELSEEFCRENSLFRHAAFNANTTTVGYLEDNRRVKAIKLRQNRSDALFLPLSCLSYCIDPGAASWLLEGATFDKIGDHPICKKYERPYHGHGMRAASAGRRPSRVDARLFPEQFQITHFLRVREGLDPDEFCYVTQKLHGTSIRIGYPPVARNLSIRDRIARRLGVKVKDTEFAMIYGSHHVVKDSNNPDQQHYYEHDIWSLEGHKLDGLIPEGYVVYGELVGWVPFRQDNPGTGAHQPGDRAMYSEPIQEHYTYEQPPGTCHLYVYRVTVINGQGVACDLSWPAVKEFCATTGLDHVAELWSGRVHDLDENSLALFLNTKFRDGALDMTSDGIAYRNAVRLSDDSPCDEGIVVRIEGMEPQLYKVKSDIFVAHETKMIDADAPDLEAEEETVGL